MLCVFYALVSLRSGAPHFHFSAMFSEIQWHGSVAFLLVAVCWGCTNPFLNAGSKTKKSSIPSNATAIQRIKHEILSLVLNWRFMVPFLINQLGSVAYVWVLSFAEVSIAHPVCNALAMVFTAVTAIVLGEQPPSLCKTIVI